MKFQWAYGEDDFDVWDKIFVIVKKVDECWVEMEAVSHSYYPSQEDETLLRITVKWDGCCHVYYGDIDGNGYMHQCGSNDIDKHFALVRFCYMLAQKLMEAQGQTYMSEQLDCDYKEFDSQQFGFSRVVEEI